MALSAVAYKISEIDSLAKKLASYALDAGARQDLLASLGAEIVEQTQRRIEEEQTDPEGKAWKTYAPWSKKYAKYRASHAGFNGLYLYGRSHQLADSMEMQVSSDSVRAGATMKYAAAHQYGYKPKNIPARPYLGLSAGNIKELENAIDEFMARKAA